MNNWPGTLMIGPVVSEISARSGAEVDGGYSPIVLHLSGPTTQQIVGKSITNTHYTVE